MLRVLICNVFLLHSRTAYLTQIDKNKQLVEELSKYLPDNRAGLTPGVARVSTAAATAAASTMTNGR